MLKITKHIAAKAVVCKVVIIFIVTLFSACSKREVIYIDDDEAWLNDERPVVFFLSEEDKMGDLGYYDNLYRGVVRAVETNNLLLYCLNVSPGWFDEILSSAADIPYGKKILFVIANNEYEEEFRAIEDSVLKNEKYDILLVESNDTLLPIYSISCVEYGVCYLAGCVVGDEFQEVSSALILFANDKSSALERMRKGFCDGIAATDGEIRIGRSYISNSFNDSVEDGYSQSDYVYRNSDTINKLFQLVFPLCGGSVQGLLRYNREHPESFYTIGIDVDMQAYSSRVPFSVVKHLDKGVEEWIGHWAKGDGLDKHQSLGLADAYTEIIAADGYKDRVNEVVSRYLQTAIKKEKEYEGE